MYWLRIILHLISFSFFSLLSAIEPENVSFDHIFIDDGLSQSTVLSIHQDNEGFLWFGTIDGLNRYDGYSFEIYRHKKNDSLSLSDNYITNIKEDIHGHLWIGTKSGGLNVYDRINGQFRSFKNPPGSQRLIASNTVNLIEPDQNGFIWFSNEGHGLSILNPHTKNFHRYLHNTNDTTSLSSNNINVIFSDRKKNIWIGTNEGLDRYDADNGEFDHYQFLLDDCKSKRVTSIYEDDYGKIWFGTARGDLVRFDRMTYQTKYFKFQISDENMRRRIEVRFIYQVSPEQMIIGTYGAGLILLNPQTGSQDYFMHQSNDPRSLSNNFIISMLVDRSNILWIGTLKGINKIDLKPKKFALMRYNADNPRIELTKKVRISNFISAIYKRSNNEILCGTYGSTAFAYNPSANRIDPILPTDLAGSRIVWAIHEDSAKRTWFGSDRGLVSKSVTGTVAQYDLPDTFLAVGSDQILRSIIGPNTGKLWLGYYSHGLFEFDISTAEFSHYKPHIELEFPFVRIISLFLDSKEILWVATDGRGLLRFDTNKREFLPAFANANLHNLLQSARVNSVREDRQGRIWIAADKGLFLLKPDHSIERHFTVEDGLENDFIYAVECDHKNQIWFTTNRGLTKINYPDSGDLKLRHYDVYDGLQGNEFNTDCSHLAADGTLYFGGVDGFNYFHPQKLNDNANIPPVSITAFKINDAPQSYNPSKMSLKLPYNQNKLSFESAALDYTNSAKNQYAHFLEGFDGDWIYTGSKRSVTYTNLAPGDYIFRVRGSNNDHYWNDYGNWMKISIAPPFWMTGPAYVLYIIIIFILITVFTRWRSGNLERRNRQLQERVDEKSNELRRSYEILSDSQRQLVESAKMRAIGTMASGLAHDFNNMLSIILGSVELLGTKIKDAPLRKHLDHIYTAAIDGSEIIKKIQDFGRKPQNRTVKSLDINSLLKDVVEITQFKWINQKRLQGITIEIETTLSELPAILADASELRVAFTNVLINAIEAFEKSGKIKIQSMLHDEQWVRINIADQGVGIPNDTLDRIFEPFYSTKGVHGNGLGLSQVYGIIHRSNGSIQINSHPGSGTEVIIDLPADFSQNRSKADTAKKSSQTLIRKNILVIEDEVTIREIYDGILGANGYALTMAETGEEGLEIYYKNQYDLIICDLGLPGINGWEVIQQIREKNDSVPIMVITGWGNEVTENKMEEFNVQRVVTKPVGVQALLDYVSQLVNN